jgi:hypothetical protein
VVIADFVRDPLVHLACAVALALLMGLAGLHKLRASAAFASVLDGYASALGWLLPSWLRAVLRRVLPWLELLAAGAVLASYWIPWAAWPTVLLLGIYAGVLTLSLRRGLAIEDCGCHFGATRQAPSVALVWRNLFLLLLALNLTLPSYERALLWFDALTLGFGLLSAVVAYLVFNLLISNRTLLREL